MEKFRKSLLLVLCVSALLVSGCTKKNGPETVQDNNQNQVQSEQQVKEQEATQTPEPAKVENGAIGTVIENGAVKVTMPASILGEDAKKTAEKVKENRGFKEVNVDGDNVTFTMTKEQHEDWLEDTADNIEKTADTFIKDFPTVQEVSFDDDFTKIEIEVNKASYKSERDKVVADGLAVSMFTYQSLNGVKKEDLKVSAIFVDDESDEQIEAVEILGNK